ACNKLISLKLVDLVQMNELDEDKQDDDDQDGMIMIKIPITIVMTFNDDENHCMNVGGDEGPDAEDDDEELYRDVNINMEGRDVQMTDVHTTQVLEDTHLTLTPFAEAVSYILGIVDRNTDHQMNEAIKVAVQLQYDRLRDEAQAENEDFINKLDKNIQKIIKEQVKFAEAVSYILGIVDRNTDHQMNEAIKVAVQLQSDRLRDEAQAENEDFINKLDKNIQKIIKEQVKTSYVVAADLSELELKKILIEKMESNKSIHRSDEQRNLYKALVDAYECDKIILDTYGDTVTLKRRRDDADKDEKPSAGSDRGSKRRREGKKPESTSAPKKKASKTTGKSTEGFKSHQKTISDLAKQADSRASFNELMDTLVDFSAFLMNQLNVDTLTPELLVGLTYELMKGSCKSLVELEIFLEEVYKAITDQLDWNNLVRTALDDRFKGIRMKYLPQTIWKRSDKERAAAMIQVIDKQRLEKFVGGRLEGDLKRLRIQDIEDMLLLLVQGKLTNLTVEERFAFNVSLRMFTKSIVIQRRMEDLQFGVESYQKKLNITNPDTYRSDLKRKEAYTAYSNPRGFIYQNKDKHNRLMRIDELHKFSDDTLNDVRTALDDRLKGIRMKYLPQTIWKRSDKERAAAMI
nr:hypothetical protein [Tanacetum cinerariifolium]